MISDKKFWMLVSALIAYLIVHYTGLPITDAQVLTAILVILSFIGIYPSLRARAIIGFLEIFKSLEFWTLVATLIAFVVSFYAPELPLDTAIILGLIVYLLKLVGIDPSVLRAAATVAVIAAEQAHEGGGAKKAYAMIATEKLLAEYGYKDVDSDVIDVHVERAVYNQFNDPVAKALRGG